MIKKPLGIGIVGAGHILGSHAQAYRALPELSRLVAVADVDAKRARRAKTLYGFADACDDPRALLARDDIHAVSICTPPSVHAALVVDAIRAGKHVLCEKPMTVTLADADDIIRAADASDLTVAFVFQLRSDATHRRIRRMIGQGHIGRVLAAHVRVHLRKTPAYYHAAPGRGSWRGDGGGVLINQAIHQLDALISFLGEPVAVSAAMDTFVQPIEAEDTITGWVRFRSGAIATIDCTVCAQKKEFSIAIVGENAGLCVSGDPDAGKFDWRIDSKSSAARRELRRIGLRECPSPSEPPKWLTRLRKLSAKARRRPPMPSLHRGHTPFVRAFLQSAITGDPPQVPPREAKRSLALAVALYESALTRRIVDLPLPADSCCYRGVATGDASLDSPEPAPQPVETRGLQSVGSGEQTG